MSAIGRTLQTTLSVALDLAYYSHPSILNLTMSSPVVLILGAGARVGQSSAQAFQAAGYRIAIASRSLEHGKTNSSGFLELRVDLSKPEQIPTVFETVEQILGAPPSVVIYNGSGS